MPDTFVCPIETQRYTLKALDEAHKRLEQAAGFADAMYHTDRAKDLRRTADLVIGAMRRLNGAPNG